MQPVKVELVRPPVIGETAAGQKIFLGGFSGLRYLGKSPTGLYQFVTHTDRGPNTDERVVARGQERPFALPEFQPRLVFLDADPRLGKMFVRAQVPLSHADGRPVSGLPPSVGAELAVDFAGRSLPADDQGMDLEGVALAPDGTFWLCDEYAPSVARFSADGVLLDRLVPGKGLPESVRYRRYNRGFEGIAISGNRLFAALESPLDNPPSQGQRNSRNSRLTRIVEVDLVRRGTVAQYAYLLDEADSGKLADLCVDGPDVLLAVEKGEESLWIHQVQLAAATNLQRLSSAISGPMGKLETLSLQELAANGVAPVRKSPRVDLRAMGITAEKVEGVDRVDEKFVAVITDNDFGLAGGLDLTKGYAETKEEPPAIWFIPLK